MTSRERILATTLALAAGVFTLAARADAQTVRAGIVTTMNGTATVARVSLARPAVLNFKDDVYVQDRITTEKDALVRVLLGGKAMLTIRERTVVTITERPGASTVAVGSGRVAVSVIKSKMRPGEVVEVTTPNAVAAIRGTVIVAEVEPALQGVRSTITVLTGIIDVTRFDGVRSSGPATVLGALQQVVITGANPVGTPAAISREAAQRLGNEFSVRPKSSPHAMTAPARQAVIEQAFEQASRAVAAIPQGSGGGQGNSSGGSSQASQSASGASAQGGGSGQGGGSASALGSAGGNNGSGTGLALGSGSGGSSGSGTGLALGAGNGNGTGLALGAGNGNGNGNGNALGLLGGNKGGNGNGNANGNANGKKL